MPNTIQPVIQKYIVDFASNNNFLFVKGVQGDGHGTRYVDLSFTNYGQPYLIDNKAVTIAIRGTKPDGSVIFNECQIIDTNTARVEITQQMSAVAGKSDYEISIMSNTENRTLTSFPFTIVISKSSFDIGYVVSSDEFQLLIKKINEVQILEDKVDKVVERGENTINEILNLEREVRDNETKRNNDFTQKINDIDNATNRANDVCDDLIQKRDNGFFNGADGKDGKDGTNGVVTDVSADQIAFTIEEGNLVLTYDDGNITAQNYSINTNGELVYTF